MYAIINCDDSGCSYEKVLKLTFDFPKQLSRKMIFNYYYCFQTVFDFMYGKGNLMTVSFDGILKGRVSEIHVIIIPLRSILFRN